MLDGRQGLLARLEKSPQAMQAFFRQGRQELWRSAAQNGLAAQIFHLARQRDHGPDHFGAQVIEGVQIEDQTVERTVAEFPPQCVGFVAELRVAEHFAVDFRNNDQRGTDLLDGEQRIVRTARTAASRVSVGVFGHWENNLIGHA